MKKNKSLTVIFFFLNGKVEVGLISKWEQYYCF